MKGLVIRDYYYLTKPGIIRGNLIAAVAGFLLASGGDVDWGIFLGMLVGLGLIIASACVFNNYLDRSIDSKMDRTSKRALVIGSVSERNALVFATTLGFAGSLVLGTYTDWLAQVIALFGLFTYVMIYGYFKRRTIYGTLVGSIAGAVPPVVGYVAVTNSLDTAALLLFIILVCWQMPHFYAIAIWRLADYKAAAIPVWPAVKGVYKTKVQILVFIVAFTVASSLLSVYDYTSTAFLVLALVLGLSWMWIGVQGFNTKNDTSWAKKMFLFSLVVMLATCVGISVDSLVYN